MQSPQSFRRVAAALLPLLLLLAPALVAADQESPETAAEQTRSLAAEQAAAGSARVAPGPRARTTNRRDRAVRLDPSLGGAAPGISVLDGPTPGPLFVGVDNTAVDAQRIDVVTNAFSTAFSGNQVWGSAYDPVGDQVYFNSGSTLLVWPVGGAVSSLGTIVDGTGAPQAIVSLAFYNGVLYGTKNIANEAIWTIDTNTLVATVFIDYTDGDFDFGGLAVDPATGEFYGTNDDTTPNGNGLFRINMDGTATLITPYPNAEVDIDGLTIGDGRAYFVTDEPGSVYIWDFALAAFQTPLNNPWTTFEIFSAGAWLGAPGTPEITLEKTVGLDENLCATESVLEVPVGTVVQYCFLVTNTGTVSFDTHDLVDSQLGTILSGFSYVLVPGASAWVNVEHVATASVTNVATWTASDQSGASAEATATATLNVTENPLTVPTLSSWGLLALALAMAALAVLLLRRRRHA